MTTIPVRAPSWTVPLLAVAVLAVATSAAIVATSTPTVAPPAHSSAEQTYLNLLYPQGASDAQTKRALTLGRGACATMESGSGDHAAYRLAFGQLMADQVAPSWAALVVHSALVSGLCTAR
jgi:hypothetical protein